MNNSKAIGTPGRGFPRVLATAIGDSGLSLRKVAVVAGLSPSYLSRVLRGERGTPSSEAVRRLAETLNMPEKKLLAEAGYIPKGDKKLARLVRLACNMESKELSQLLREAESILSSRGAAGKQGKAQ